MSKIEFKRSRKKAYIWSLIGAFFLLCGVPIILAVIKGAFSKWVIAFYIVAVGVLILTAIRKTKDAICPKCNTDLYDFIDLGQNKNIQTKYCISCGQEIEI